MEIFMPVLSIFISLSAIAITIISGKMQKDTIAEYRNLIQSQQRLLLQRKDEAEIQE